MSDAEMRAQYLWRPAVIPVLCVVMFIIAAMIVVAYRQA